MSRLRTVLEAELVFWVEATERLDEGWWAGDRMQWTERKHYYLHIGRVVGPLQALEHIAAPGFEDVARRTRQQWSATPALDEAWNGLIVRACDAALGAVAAKQDAGK